MARTATQLVMTYDDQGNASFKSEVVTNNRNVGSPKVFTIGEAINRFQFDTSPATQDDVLPDPLTEQLNVIRKFITGESSDDSDRDSGVILKEFPQFNIRDSVTKDITNALGESAGKKFNKYAIMADITGGLKDINKTSRTVGMLGVSTPTFDPITSLLVTGLNKYSERQRENLIKEYHDSDYYTDKMNRMQTEYETYGDYDAFTDYSAGPTYTREDLKPGTVFDAEDDETNYTPPSNGIMSPPPAYDFDDSMGDSGSSQDTASTAGDAPGYSGPSPF